MAACAHCGAKLVEGGATCPACGERVRNRPMVETLPLGSLSAPPSLGPRSVRPGDGTLAFGSGVSLEGMPPPSIARRADRKPEREKPAQPRSERGPALKRIEPPRSSRPIARPQPRPRVETGESDVLPPRISTRLGTPRARVALGAALVAGLVLASIAALIALRSHKDQSEVGAHVTFDRSGNPELELWCPACPDGTEIRVATRSATFSASRAFVEIEPPVSPGEFRINASMRKPTHEFKPLDLATTIDWVVSPDLRGLSQSQPKLAVVFDAKSDVGIIVDGHALPPTPSGTRRYEIDITADLTGQSETITTLTRRIPYIVSELGRPSARSEIEFVTQVVPLRIDAPGESAVLETGSFMLAGLTESGGTVTVEGRPITVDPSGRFAQLMSVSSIGDTLVSVRASAPGQAPRLVPIRVKRVASLDQEAVRFAAQATSSYAALDSELDKKIGWKVALEGRLVDASVDGYASTALLDVEKGCTQKPCLVRLSIGGRIAQTPNERLTAYGTVVGNSTDPSTGRTIPEVRVEFLRGKK